MKLQTKLLSLILPLIAISSMAIGIAVFSYLKTESKKSVDQEAYTILRQIKSSLDSHIEATQKQISMMAENKSVQKLFTKYLSGNANSSPNVATKNEVTAYFNNLKNQYSSYENIYFLGKDLNPVNWNNKNQTQSEAWKILLVKALNNNNIQHFNIQKHVDGTATSAYVIRVFDTEKSKKTLLGYLVVTENYSFLDSVLNSASEYDNNFIVLANQNYVIQNFEKFIGANKIINREKPESFFMQHNDEAIIEGDNYFYYMDTIGQGDSVINVISTKAFEDQRFLIAIYIIVIGSLFSVLISSILVIFINRVVVNRIRHIENISKRIANDDLSLEINTNSQDEIGQLARSFNLMLDSLASSKEKINQLAFYDELTGLANRRSLNSHMERVIREAYVNGSGVAVLMMDLDDFKDVNDIYGHHIGDELLIEISSRLKSCLFKTLLEYKYHSELEHCVCRIAGDEFTIVVSGYKGDKIINNIARNIMGSFNKSFFIDDIELKNSVSMGLATYPENGFDRHTLLKNADMAMYEAKKCGKNGFEVFHQGMKDKIKAKKEMEGKIIKALSQDEFTLYFQPKVDAKTNSIIEFEALIRWDHPDEGMISPSIFIPFAEENGMINAIGNWVVKELCIHIRELEKLGWKNFKISFNTSPQQLQDKVFTTNIQRCIKKFSINPSHLEMEITEHSLAKDLNETIRHLNEVKAMGIDISLDDFGTGYSSLSYLEKMPIDTIKIDRSFINGSNNNPARLAIIATIVTLAKGLGMKTVAEGVENKDELKVVSDIGCDLIQGYYYYPPLPFEDMKKVSDFGISDSLSYTG